MNGHCGNSRFPLNGDLSATGKQHLQALGAIRVEVSMKKISKRNTMSVMPDMAKLAITLFLDFKFMLPYLAGSFSRSIKPEVPASMLLITLSTRATRVL